MEGKRAFETPPSPPPPFSGGIRGFAAEGLFVGSHFIYLDLGRERMDGTTDEWMGYIHTTNYNERQQLTCTFLLYRGPEPWSASCLGGVYGHGRPLVA